MIPGSWALVQFDALKRFCTSQFKTQLPFYTQLISTFFHIIWCHIFIKILDLGIVGAAISLNLTYFINMFIIEYWVRSSHEFEDTWIKHDSRSFTEWGEYMSIGWYGAILECLSWWNLNICFMFSGYLGVS
jgi:MATE family multidrug resistance protein